MKKYGITLGFAALALSAVGCSKVDFGATNSATLLSSASTGAGTGGDASGNLNQNGNTNNSNGTNNGNGTNTGTGSGTGTGTTGTGTTGTGTTGTGTGTGTAGTGTPTGTGTGTTTAASVPSVHFVGPPCHINTSCQASFVLDKALPAAFAFHWRTNDNAYTFPAPSPGVIFGKPMVHYVPTSGDVVFQPGQTTKTVFVQNINPDPTVAIVIQVIMSQCNYSSTVYNCSAVFH